MQSTASATRWDQEYAQHEFDPAYDADVFVRAQQKLAALREGRVRPQPLGRLVGPVVLAVLFAAVPAAVSLVGAAAYLWGAWGSRSGVPIALAIVGLGFAALAMVVIRGAKANTPKRALKIYFKSLGRGRTGRARKLVAPNDLDGFPRYPAEVPGLVRRSPGPFRFEATGDFARYWNELLRAHTAPYCLVNIGSVKTRAVGTDCLVVDFRLQLIMNTQLWWLLVVVLWPLALVMDLVTRKTVRADLRKVLVRAGDEWHLFNGAWQEPDEVDLDWLGA
ncbi:MAG: hypothetical protein ACYTEZ_01855 [Planctomycetota bacterium]|jgi:hypothetical protein